MDQNFFTQNPDFQNISPEKLAFLMNFMNQEKPDSSRDMMTFLMSFVTKARNQNLSFTTDETDFIIQHLRQGLNPAEQQRIAQSFSNYMRHFKLSSPLFVSMISFFPFNQKNNNDKNHRNHIGDHRITIFYCRLIPIINYIINNLINGRHSTHNCQYKQNQIHRVITVFFLLFCLSVNKFFIYLKNIFHLILISFHPG